MHVTVLLQAVNPGDQLGYDAGFRSLVSRGRIAGYSPFCYRAANGPSGWSALWQSVAADMRATGSEVLMCQFFHGSGLPDPRAGLAQIASLPQRPIVATTCGDGFGPRFAAPPQQFVRAAVASDITFCTSMGRLATGLTRAGAKRVTLMPHGACDVRFGATQPPELNVDRPFDVLFVGNRPEGRNFAKHLFWSGRRRLELVEVLSRRFGPRFGVFGRGWDGFAGWQGPIPFDQQSLVCQQSSVVFGGYPGSSCDYYLSDRPFSAMVSGVPFVDFDVPRIDRILKRSEEVFLFHDADSLLRIIELQLARTATERQETGRVAANAVRDRHLVSHRVELMVEIFDELLEARARHRDALAMPLPFFHDGVDQSAEQPTAFLNW